MNEYDRLKAQKDAIIAKQDPICSAVFHTPNGQAIRCTVAKNHFGWHRAQLVGSLPEAGIPATEALIEWKG